MKHSKSFPWTKWREQRKKKKEKQVKQNKGYTWENINFSDATTKYSKSHHSHKHSSSAKYNHKSNNSYGNHKNSHSIKLMRIILSVFGSILGLIILACCCSCCVRCCKKKPNVNPNSTAANKNARAYSRLNEEGSLNTISNNSNNVPKTTNRISRTTATCTKNNTSVKRINPQDTNQLYTASNDFPQKFTTLLLMNYPTFDDNFEHESSCALYRKKQVQAPTVLRQGKSEMMVMGMNFFLFNRQKW